MSEDELIKLATDVANREVFINREFYIRVRYALSVLQMYAKKGAKLYNTIGKLLKREDLDKIINKYKKDE